MGLLIAGVGHSHFYLLCAVLVVDPGPCPDCGKLSQRVFNTMPNLRQIDSTKKNNIERNIKSQFEPHVCGPNCEHEAPSLISPISKQKTKVQSYNGPRSWVIEHSI